MISNKLIPLLLSISGVLSFPTIVERAGGPTAKPIPSSCSIQQVKPVSGTQSFSLTPEFQHANQVYAYYLDPEIASSDESTQIQQCLEQCYGIGTGCTSVLWAHDVSYTTDGKESKGTACLFMHQDITPNDLAPKTDGSYTSAQALVIACP